MVHILSIVFGHLRSKPRILDLTLTFNPVPYTSKLFTLLDFYDHLFISVSGSIFTSLQQEILRWRSISVTNRQYMFFFLLGDQHISGKNLSESAERIPEVIIYTLCNGGIHSIIKRLTLHFLGKKNSAFKLQTHMLVLLHPGILQNLLQQGHVSN